MYHKTEIHEIPIFGKYGFNEPNCDVLIVNIANADQDRRQKRHKCNIDPAFTSQKIFIIPFSFFPYSVFLIKTFFTRE